MSSKHYCSQPSQAKWSVMVQNRPQCSRMLPLRFHKQLSDMFCIRFASWSFKGIICCWCVFLLVLSLRSAQSKTVPVAYTSQGVFEFTTTARRNSLRFLWIDFRSVISYDKWRFLAVSIGIILCTCAYEKLVLIALWKAFKFEQVT